MFLIAVVGMFLPMVTVVPSYGNFPTNDRTKDQIST